MTIVPMKHADPHAPLRAWLGQLKNRIAERRERERREDEEIIHNLTTEF